jgi:CRP-like cAMP-binding protein
MYDVLLGTVSSLISPDEEDINTIKSLFRPVLITKGTVLINMGDIADYVYFVNSGYLRYYKINTAGEEITIHLAGKGDFAASFSSFVCHTRSEEILHAVTDSCLLTITYNDLEKLYSTGTKWQVFGRKLMEFFLLEKEKRIIDQISLSAQDRYIKMLEQKPELVQNIPIQYLASYIGIKPESLSRIRKQIFLTNVK